MSLPDDPAGMAALSICEALLLALNDYKLLPQSEIVGVLTDAATTHENAARAGSDPGNAARHEAAALLINRIISGGNLIRSP